MSFWITIKEGYKQYRYQVEHTPITEQTEHFKVQGYDGHLLWKATGHYSGVKD